jgi:flagellar basal-body rod protein FlgG
MDAIQIAGSALHATGHWIDVISQNLANINTPAYKRASVQFAELVRPADPMVEATAERRNVAAGFGTHMLPNRVEFLAGPLQATGIPTDVAIQGSGLLEVTRSNGELAYTRVGRLRVDADGRLALPTGELLTSDIVVPAEITEIAIGPDGRAAGRVGESPETVELGQLMLARVADPGAMQPLGNGLYATTEASGDAIVQAPGEDGMGTLLAEHLEASNVDLNATMSQLLLAQRAYQLNARVIQVFDTMYEAVMNIKR